MTDLASIATGAAQGAGMGMAFGPIGAAVGGLLGAAPDLLNLIGVHLGGDSGEQVAKAALDVAKAVTGRQDPTQADIAGLPPDQMAQLRVQLAQIAAQQAIAERQAQVDELKALVSVDIAQTEVNKAEAASSSVFVAGWRPFIGWCCGFGILWVYFIGPLLSFVFSRPMPGTDLGNLLILVGNLLGMAGLRTYEKRQGVANGH